MNYKGFSIKTVIIVFLNLFPGITLSQTSNFYDSIDLARNKMNEQNFSEGLKILNALERTDPKDIHTIRLKGQLLYQSKDLPATHEHFINAISRNPDQSILRLDFGRILFRTGFFQNSWTENLIPTWGFELRQKTVEQLSLSAGINRSPYLYTLASLTQNILPTTFTAGLGRETGDKWTGKAMVQQLQFQDNNTIRTGSVWLLIPVINQPYFIMNIGYAFMMSDSEENRFALVEPIEGTVIETEIGQVFPGIFDPYFTPQNQMVHSALAKLDFKFSTKLSLSLNNNIGVYAKIDNPNFIFYGVSDPQPGTQNPGPPAGTPSNPNAPGKPIVENPNQGTSEISSSDLYRVLVPTTYFPLDLKGKFTWKTNSKLTFTTEYAYLKTIFFDSHAVSMGLNWHLSHD